MKPVTLYGTAWCPYCVRAEQLLRRKRVVPEKIDVGADAAQRQHMIERSGRRSVPQIFIGSLHVGGFDALSELVRNGRLDALLDDSNP